MVRDDLPHIAFYVGDWRRDAGVQSLSYYHRGIWLELLMFMHCSEQRGRLVLNGKPMSDAAVARLLGLSQQEGANAIAVLLEAGVPSRDENGALYNRRMVEEERIRQAKVEAGRRGGMASKSQANGKQTPDIDNGKRKAKDLEEVVAFCREILLPKSDAEWFWHKCEANGWRNGGEPIRDWRQTLRSWKAGGYVPSIKNPRKGSTPPAPPKQPKPQPEGWTDWLRQHYPGAKQADYHSPLMPDSVKQEFMRR